MNLPALNKNSSVPLKEQLRQWILQQISHGTWEEGDCIPSINKMSRGFEIARETVRQTLETLVNKGILVPEQGRGYFISKRSQRKFRVGLLGKLDGVYIRPICEGLAKELGSQVPVLVLDSQRSFQASGDIIQNLAYHQSIDRLLVVPVRGEEENINRILEPYRRYFRVAWLDRAPQETPDHQFLCDYQGCVRIAMEFFEQKGIDKRIYFSRNAEDRSVFSSMRRAWQIFEDSRNSSADFFSDFEKVLSKVKKTKGCLGILAETDQEGVYLQSRLLSRGINIPGEVSLISCDNTELTDLIFPRITSVDPGFKKLGILAGKWIKNDFTDHRVDQKKIIISPYLVEKDST